MSYDVCSTNLKFYHLCSDDSLEVQKFIRGLSFNDCSNLKDPRGPTKQYKQGILTEREGKLQCNGLQSVLKIAATG